MTPTGSAVYDGEENNTFVFEPNKIYVDPPQFRCDITCPLGGRKTLGDKNSSSTCIQWLLNCLNTWEPAQWGPKPRKSLETQDIENTKCLQVLTLGLLRLPKTTCGIAVGKS